MDQSLAAVYEEMFAVSGSLGEREAGRETRCEMEVNVAKDAKQPGDDTHLTRSSVACGWTRRLGR